MKPEYVDNYNTFIYGMASADQYLALYPFVRKTAKWPKKVLFCLPQCALFNFFQLYVKSN
jgi:hypothetical protein